MILFGVNICDSITKVAVINIETLFKIKDAKSGALATKALVFHMKARFFGMKRRLSDTISRKEGFIASKINGPKLEAFDMEINDFSMETYTSNEEVKINSIEIYLSLY